MSKPKLNADDRTVEAFGEQWDAYRQDGLDNREEQQFLFDRYFSIMPWDSLPENAVGFDAGAGSGRWARLCAARSEVGALHCIDASEKALNVARENLAEFDHCEFHACSIEDAPLEAGSMDFGYSLGVLHHMPDTAGAIKDCADFLKPGAPLLLYLYYAFDNKPLAFKILWRLSEGIRFCISNAPVGLRNVLTEIVAALIYWPLARLSWVLEKIGVNVDNLPLSDYRSATYYRMRHNARDRFGTPLEQRFTREEIEAMMLEAGLQDIQFRDDVPFWCAVGIKK